MPKTILIVDDDELSVKMFVDLLEKHGYHIIITDNGRDALKLARENHPDLIHMDIQLPGISGLEVFKSLRDAPETRDVPVIAVTAFAMKMDREKYLEAGFDDYVPKPVAVQKYLNTIAKFLN